MLICPVCRSQNMESAKFCGNCGNPFPRPSPPTTSFTTCAQGHKYAAVYQNCPYCPPINTPPETTSDFATRIGETRVSEPITAFEPAPPPPPPVAVPPSTDFATRIDVVPTVFETRIDAEATTLEASYAWPSAQPTKADPPPAPSSAPTEVISSFAQTTMAEIPILDLPETEETVVMEAMATQVSEPLSLTNSYTEAPLRVDNFHPPVEPVAPPPPEPVKVSVPPPPAPPEIERRTMIVESAALPRASKGKLVGWLVSYSQNPDGEDHRLYSGYNRLGANPVCDIVIEDETVSGSHAIIVYREGRCLIKDDLSRNGTFVNGREITEAHPLQNYDEVRIGNTYLTFVAAQRSS